MKIKVHVREKEYTIRCADGRQRIRWLGLVGAAAYGSEFGPSRSSYAFVPAEVRLEDGSVLDANVPVAEVLSDGDHVTVLLRGDEGAAKGPDEIGWNEDDAPMLTVARGTDPLDVHLRHVHLGWEFKNGAWFYNGIPAADLRLEEDGTIESKREEITFTPEMEELFAKMRLEQYPNDAYQIMVVIAKNWESLGVKFKQYAAGSYQLADSVSSLSAVEVWKFAKDHSIVDRVLTLGRLDALFQQVDALRERDERTWDRGLFLHELLDLLVLCGTAKYPEVPSVGAAFAQLMDSSVRLVPFEDADPYAKMALRNRKLRALYRRFFFWMHRVFDVFRGPDKSPENPNTMALAEFLSLCKKLGVMDSNVTEAVCKKVFTDSQDLIGKDTEEEGGTDMVYPEFIEALGRLAMYKYDVALSMEKKVAKMFGLLMRTLDETSPEVFGDVRLEDPELFGF